MLQVWSKRLTTKILKQKENTMCGSENYNTNVSHRWAEHGKRKEAQRCSKLKLQREVHKKAWIIEWQSDETKQKCNKNNWAGEIHERIQWNKLERYMWSNKWINENNVWLDN